MGWRHQLLHRDAAGYHPGEVELAARCLALPGIRSLDERIFGQRLAFALRRIAWPDNRRIDELVHALRWHEQLRVLELDDDGVARQDVGDLHREHVRAALLQQRGALALALCRLEFTRGLFRS